MGGGGLIDKAKVWRRKASSTTVLAAVPSLWGSGAENSRVAVINELTLKRVYVGDEWLPDYRAYWSELALSIPDTLVRYACGDVWAHALEAMLCPLTHGDVLGEAAEVVRSICRVRIANDPAWFELSAKASAIQARTGVGLVHGIAHVLEPVLRQKYPDAEVGHARLCSTLLFPVFEFNRSVSSKVSEMLAASGIDEGTVFAALSELFESDFYVRLIPTIRERWSEILRHPLSRMNSTLVRPSALDFFLEFQP